MQSVQFGGEESGGVYELSTANVWVMCEDEEPMCVLRS